MFCLRLCSPPPPSCSPAFILKSMNRQINEQLQIFCLSPHDITETERAAVRLRLDEDLKVPLQNVLSENVMEPPDSSLTGQCVWCMTDEELKLFLLKNSEKSPNCWHDWSLTFWMVFKLGVPLQMNPGWSLHAAEPLKNLLTTKVLFVKCVDENKLFVFTVNAAQSVRTLFRSCG